MRLIIKDLTITGFKGYKEGRNIVLGEKRTLISADNGIGKSSIGEAICWLFTGCDIYGNEKAATRLVNDDKPKITEVELNCVIDGAEKNIIRRKKGSTNGLFIDGSKADNSDLAELYKSKDIFLSIFNPYYFPNLAPKDAKQLLSEVLKPVPKEEVFAELGEYFTEILKKNNFKIPETFLSDKNAEIKEHKENIVFLEGKISALEIKEVPEIREFNISELQELQKKLDALKEDSKDNILADLQAKQRDIEFKIKCGPEGLKPLINVENLEYKRSELLNRYNNLKSKRDNFEEKEEACPNCGHVLKTNIEQKKQIQNDMASIVKEGGKIKGEIDKAVKENELVRADNERISKEFYDALNGQLADIKAQIEKHIYDTTVRKEKVAADIASLQSKIQIMKDQEREIDIHNSMVNSIIKSNAEAEKTKKKAEEDIKNSENKIAELKLAIDAGKQFNTIRLNKQTATINQYLDKVELSFEELTKDGELKEKFKILYEGKEFNKLSNSERIKAGLEISNLISNVMNVKIPVFVDDSESITVVKQLDTQMILTKVVEGLQEIKVEVIEQ